MEGNWPCRYVNPGLKSFPPMKNTNNEEIRSNLQAIMHCWETGDVNTFESFMHEEVMFAIPGKRMNKFEILNHFNNAIEILSDIKIYIFNIVVEQDQFAIEFQFACTSKNSGQRTCSSALGIGKVLDGKIIEIREYWDPYVEEMQSKGEFPLDEGQAPFPWPQIERS